MARSPLFIPFRSDNGELIENIRRDETRLTVWDVTNGQYVRREVPVEWRPNFIFDDGLAVTGHYQGRSAHGVEVVSVNDGKHYSMTTGGFIAALSVAEPSKFPVGGVQRLVLTGHWTFTSYGGYFRVVAINPDARP